jgi:hypothetical protein
MAIADKKLLMGTQQGATEMLTLSRYLLTMVPIPPRPPYGSEGNYFICSLICSRVEHTVEIGERRRGLDTANGRFFFSC